MIELTEFQRKVLDYIFDYKGENDGVCPSMREMCEYFGWKSTKSCQDVLDALKKKGYIRRKFNAARSIVILKRD